MAETDRPDVQRIISKFVQLQAENKRLREAMEEILTEAKQCRELVCCYMNSENHCDCKYIGVGRAGSSSEATGCCEFRNIAGIAQEALNPTENKNG